MNFLHNCGDLHGITLNVKYRLTALLPWVGEVTNVNRWFCGIG